MCQFCRLCRSCYFTLGLVLVLAFPTAGRLRREDRAGCPKFPIRLNFREGYPRCYSQTVPFLMPHPFSFHPLRLCNLSRPFQLFVPVLLGLVFRQVLKCWFNHGVQHNRFSCHEFLRWRENGN